MKLLIFLVILTLVSVPQISDARPHDKVDPTIGSQDEYNNKTELVDFDKENISLTIPKNSGPKVKKKDYYPYLQSLSPRFGILFDQDDISDLKNLDVNQAFGVHYLFPRFRSPQLEVTVDVLSDSVGHVTIAKRWTINERSSFRPFYKLGVTSAVDGNEGLATFTNIENYLVKGALGLEDYLKAPASVRLELELLAGTEDIWLMIALGYSWAW